MGGALQELLPRLQQQLNQHRCRCANLPAKLVARTACLDAHDTNGPSPTPYRPNDGVPFEIECDWAMDDRDLKLNPPTVEAAKQTFRAALPAKIPHHTARLLPGNTDLPGRELSSCFFDFRRGAVVVCGGFHGDNTGSNPVGDAK